MTSVSFSILLTLYLFVLFLQPLFTLFLLVFFLIGNGRLLDCNLRKYVCTHIVVPHNKRNSYFLVFTPFLFPNLLHLF